MERLDGGSAVPGAFAGGIVALGNFDGFHLGHQAVVGRAIDRARAEGRPALVATFDPHPVRHFRPDAPPFRLTTLDQRERLFADAGADAMVVFHFDGDLAALTAEEFVADRLVGALQVGGIVTGEDFTFGHNKGGDVRVMAELGHARGLEEHLLPLRAGLDDIPALLLSPDQAGLLRQGRVLVGIAAEDGLHFATSDDVPVALVEVQDREVRVVRGFNL